MGLKSKGITRGYPWLQRYFGRISAYIALIRPFTLCAPLVAGVIGVLVPLREISFTNVETAIYIGITLALTQAVGQVTNQYADSELDKQIKSYRPIPSGLVTKEEALGLSWLLAIFAVGRAFTIGVNFGLIILVLLGLAVFYSFPPFTPRRVHPIINLLWLAISRGTIPMLAVLSIFGTLQAAIPYLVLSTVWVFGFQGLKDTSDIEGDRKFGIKTVANTYGSAGLKAVMLLSTLLYFITAIVFGKPLMLLVIPVAIIALFTSERKVGFLENSIGWGMFYVGLALIYLLMFIGSHAF